jgi:mono/diheme cytochrome c family protein
MERDASFEKEQRQKLLRSVPRLLLCALAFLAVAGPALADDSPGLDRLLGSQGRSDHQKRIETLVFKNGKTFGWEDFSAWGEEIFRNGFIESPPTGPSPSDPVSEFFTCMTCHNYEREDPDLTVQDPDARFQWIEKTGKKIFLLQGATMAGVVNRETFYADYYTIYHHLCVPKGKELPSRPCGPFLRICGPGCRTMDPDSLDDAIQVCSAYCSAGRYLDEWELYALLAFFWDQEITLEDIDLLPEQAARVKAVLTSPSPDPREAETLRGLLAGKYAKKAGNTFRGIPKATKEALGGTLVVEYGNGRKFAGDSGRGERLWQLSCGRCHGIENMPAKAKYFTEDLDKFHKMIAKGTRYRDKPYMPNFTLERLSHQQSADILVYLKSLEK